MAHNEQLEIGEQSIFSASYDRTEQSDSESSDIIGTLVWLADAGELAPSWWSKARDKYLTKFWKKSNHLSLVIYNAQSKLAGIPFVIEADDPSVTSHVAMAEMITKTLSIGSEYAQGISTALERFYEDLLTQDNGAFLEVLEYRKDPIDQRDLSEPIRGTPIAVRHLDSFRCTRTSNPDYPVMYLSPRDNKLYKYHWSRVMYMSQMTSSRAEMNGVGFCAVSRSMQVAQTAIDVLTYKQERLGSRPANQILVGKGITGKTIANAIRQSQAAMNNRGLTRFAALVALGSANPEIGLDVINLNHMDPFDERTSIQFAMYAIAGAFGLDVTEVWPVAGSGGGGEGSAKIQNMRARGKLPAQVTEALAHQFNTKFLPPYLTMRFDFRDDEEDQQRAIIRDIRGRQRERDIGNGSLTVRAARQEMVKDGDVSRAAYEEMEWASGRLADGGSIYTLFFSDGPMSDMVDLGYSNPLDFGNIDLDEAKSRVAQARSMILTALAGTRAAPYIRELKRHLYLLEWYERDLQKNLAFQAREEAVENAEGSDAPQDQRTQEDDESEGSGESAMGRQRAQGMMKQVRGLLRIN